MLDIIYSLVYLRGKCYLRWWSVFFMSGLLFLQALICIKSSVSATLVNRVSQDILRAREDLTAGVRG